MKLLLLTPCYPPDTAAYVHLIESLSLDLVKAGHAVTVITSTTYSKPGFIGRTLWRWEERHGLRILRINTFPSARKGLFRKAAGFALFTVLSFVLGFFAGRHDLIFAASTPPTMGFSGGLLARLRGVPFVYNVQDIFPDVAIKLGVLRSPILIRFALWLEKLSYALSASVTVIGEAFAEVLQRKGVPRERLAVIPNWIDTDELKPPLRTENPFVREQGLGGKFVVLYAGNFGLSQGLETLIDAARQLQEIPDMHFLLIGDGERRPHLEQYLVASGVRNVQLLPFQPSDRLKQVFSAGHVGIVPLKAGLTSDSIPSKTWTMMAAGLPIIASIDTDSALAAFVREHGTGAVVPPESASLLASEIRKWYAARDRLQEMGASARRYTVDHIDRKYLTARYIHLFQTLVAGAKSC